jgi:hypothetical protein
MREAVEAMRHLRAQLRSTEYAYFRAIKAMDGGQGIGESLDAMHAPSVRVDLNSALSELEHSRHQARLSMITAGLDEGLSLTEVGQKMGFSRQLASRFAKEAQARD